MLPYINKWSQAKINENAEIKSILEYFADKGCLGFLSRIDIGNIMEDFTFIFKHEDEVFDFHYDLENVYTITHINSGKQKTYFRSKALSVMSDIVIDRMIDDVRQKLSIKFDSEISDDLKGVWNVFLSVIHNGFIHELYRLDNDSRNFRYDNEDKDIQINLFNDRFSIFINENGSILVETSESESFTGNVGELEFTKQLNETLTHFSNLD